MWLTEKLETAELVAMATSATTEASLPGDLETRMLRSIGVETIALRSAGQRWMVAADDMPKDIAAHHDLTELKPLDSIRAAFQTLFSTGDRLIMVSGPPPAGSDRFEIVVHEQGLRAAMLALLAQHPALLARALGDHRRAGLLGASLPVRAPDAAALRRISSPSPRRPRMLRR